jgi:hypothetical protein
MDYIFRFVDIRRGAALGKDKPAITTHTRIVAPAELVDRLSHLGYADDVALLSRTLADAQANLTAFEIAAAAVGMKLNVGIEKTAIMCINARPSTLTLRDGTVVPICHSYKYLGCLLTDSLITPDWLSDWKRRKSLAWATIHRHKNLWRSNASRKYKHQLVEALVLPLLTYGMYVYPNTVICDMLLHGTYSAMLRHCLGARVDFQDFSSHVTTESLYEFHLTFPALRVRQELTQWGHWMRDHYLRGLDHMCMFSFQWVPSDSFKLRRGQRIANSQRERILSLTNTPSQEPHAVVDLCCDRKAWKKVIDRAVMQKERSMFTRILTRRERDPRRIFLGSIDTCLEGILHRPGLIDNLQSDADSN